MNIKLHTPNSLKVGSGMATMKQFLLALLATTVSIVLTFGTAAIIDHKKKQNEKREIVMMVMYDMYNSLKSVEWADSMFYVEMDLQRQIAEDTTKYNVSTRAELARQIPNLEYTETIERIFSSNIETINTVGNVLFTENVAEFYQIRRLYKTTICDSLFNIVNREEPFSTLEGILNLDFFSYAVISSNFVLDMQHLFAQCKQMMDVTDEEINAYREERGKLEKSSGDKKAKLDSIMNVLSQVLQQINEAKKGELPRTDSADLGR